jgi:hypothetical protein
VESPESCKGGFFPRKSHSEGAIFLYANWRTRYKKPGDSLRPQQKITRLVRTKRARSGAEEIFLDPDSWEGWQTRPRGSNRLHQRLDVAPLLLFENRRSFSKGNKESIKRSEPHLLA